MDARVPGQTAPAPLPDARRVVTILGITQILAWGTSYYLLTVLAAPIAAGTGWSLTSIMGSFSAALLVSGLVAPKIGRLISFHGGRSVLAGGSLLMAGGFVVVGLAPGFPTFAAGWLVVGLAMGASLYDPAFSTLGRIYGAAARRPITTLTLFGGFASTVCWPLSAWLVGAVGWRGTCIAYAAVQIAVSLPLLLAGLPKEEPSRREPAGPAPASSRQAILSRQERRMFVLLSATLVIAGVMVTVLAVHLVTLLRSRGIDLAAAVSLGMLIGPAQVGGRVFEMAFGRRYHPIWTLTAAGMLTTAGIVLLYLGFPVLAPAFILYGAGNGIWTIARGALPLALFGPKDYPVLMGRLAMPTLIAQAVAPAAGAFVMEAGGPDRVFALLALLAVANIGVIALVHLARSAAGRPAVPGPSTGSG